MFAAQIFLGGELAARRAFHFRASQVCLQAAGRLLPPHYPAQVARGSREGNCSLGPQGNSKEDLDSELPVCSNPTLLEIFVAGRRTDGPPCGRGLSVFNKQMERGVPGGSLKVSGATLVSQVHAGEGAQSQGSAVRRPQPGTSCLSRNPPGPWGVIWHLQP